MDNPVNFSANEEDDVFLDLLMLALAGFMALVILIIPYINPPTTVETVPPPGKMLVEMAWPDQSNVDMDLWVKAPNDRPVGYSRKNGEVFDLLRDDRGYIRDLSPANYEVAYSKGLPEGEYIVNIHWYSGVEPPVPVTITVTINVDDTYIVVFNEVVEVPSAGKEITIVRFMLDADAYPISGSFHNIPIKLRSGR